MRVILVLLALFTLSGGAFAQVSGNGSNVPSGKAAKPRAPLVRSGQPVLRLTQEDLPPKPANSAHEDTDPTSEVSGVLDPKAAEKHISDSSNHLTVELKELRRSAIEMEEQAETLEKEGSALVAQADAIEKTVRSSQDEGMILYAKVKETRQKGEKSLSQAKDLRAQLAKNRRRVKQLQGDLGKTIADKEKVRRELNARSRQGTSLK